MTDDLQVERDIVIDRPADEVWRSISTAAGWEEWLVDAAMVDVAVGRGGSIVDDGVARRVSVRRVEVGSEVTFQWWEHDDPAAASEVSIQLHELPGGATSVHIVERMVLPSAAVRPALPSVWEVRAFLLAFALRSPARV